MDCCGLGDHAAQLRLLPPELLYTASQLQHAWAPFIATLVQIGDVLQVLFHQLESRVDRRALRLRSRDLLPELLDPPADDPDRAVIGAPSGQEQPALRFQSFGDQLHATLIGEAAGELDRPEVLLFGAQPGEFSFYGDELAGQLPELRISLSSIEDCQRLAGADDISLAHQEFVENAAFQMLYGLPVAVDHGESGSDHGAIQIGQQRPAGKAAEAGDDGHQPGQGGTAQARLDIVVRFGETAQGRQEVSRSVGHVRTTDSSTGSRAILGSAARAADLLCSVSSFMI